jgi:hypothetical protein
LTFITCGLGLLAAGCGPREPAPEAATKDIQQSFWANLGALCGKAYAGTIGANDGAGAGPDAFAGQALTMHVRDCSSDEIRVPFHVGEDRSRTWVFTRTEGGVRLKHDHRHEDGSPDALTMYGGDTVDAGSAFEQRFPADGHSKDLFGRAGLHPSVDNTWIVSIAPAERFSYALTRPGREFRVDFDLTRPVRAPPAPWGM